MRFTINDENKIHAYNYLSNKLKNDSYYLNHLDDLGLDNSYKAAKALNQTYKDGKLIAESLDAWCKKHLTDKQFNALRAALRKRLSRRTNDNTAIELGKATYSDLNDLAAAEGMNLKDYLAMLIEDKHKEVNPPVAYQASKRRSQSNKDV